MMNRAQKAQTVEALSERFGRAKAAFIVDFKGMNVDQVTRLRKTLFSLNSEMKIVRNTLVKLALKNHPPSEQAIASKFIGTNAVVFVYDDASASAKAITDFAKDVEQITVKVGVMDGQSLDANAIKQLASLPSKEVLRAQLLGTFMAPATSFVRVLNAVPSGLLNVLNAYKDTKES